ncbi:PAS domain-containing protein [Saccharomonospora marina]|nr:PAS domain S-box protein [Saccharomonospora marina]
MTVISVEKRIVDGADDAIAFADKDGFIRLWNAAAERMFHYTADEALGQSLDLIIPEKHRPRHWDGYRRVMKTGQTAYAGSLLAVPALRADGTLISVEFSVTLVHGETGDVEGIAAIMREVTERRAALRALQQELADLRERIGTSGEST